MLTRIKDDGRRWARRLAAPVPGSRKIASRLRTLTARSDDALRQQLTDARLKLDGVRRELADAHTELEKWRADGIQLEYRVTPRVRDGQGTAGGIALLDLLAAGDAGYARLLDDAVESAAQLADVTIEPSDDNTEPHWHNGYLPPGDAIFLTHFLRNLAPRTYLEIGSGNSTKFARRAIRRNGLSTRIVSIDPHPRAEIDTICDEVVRTSLESSDALAIFRALEPGDLVFFDGSHYCFQNSDVTAFFMELVHEIPEGCVYGIHDIFLPDDYPEAWFDRFYNEQYVLAAWLLGGAAGDQIELPGWYVSTRPQFADAQARLLEVSGAGPDRHGGAFWMRRGGAGRRE